MYFVLAMHCICGEYTKIVFAGNIQRLCLQGIYKDCVCGEYTKIVFAGNIQRLGKWLIDMRTAHWECLGLGFMQRGLAAAALMRCCWPLLCCFAAFVLLCFCALHHTDIQLLRAPKFASSSTVTNSYTSIGTRARTHMRTLHTDQLVEENAAQTTGRKLCNLALPRTHTHTHTDIYVHSFLSLLSLHCACSLCSFCNVRILHSVYNALFTLLCALCPV